MTFEGSGGGFYDLILGVLICRKIRNPLRLGVFA